jgi:hypothetical protein
VVAERPATDRIMQNDVITVFGDEHALPDKQHKVSDMDPKDAIKNESLNNCSIFVYNIKQIERARDDNQMLPDSMYHPRPQLIKAADNNIYMSVKYVYLNTSTFIIKNGAIFKRHLLPRRNKKHEKMA